MIRWDAAQAEQLFGYDAVKSTSGGGTAHLVYLAKCIYLF
jgi:hypothetical protein